MRIQSPIGVSPVSAPSGVTRAGAMGGTAGVGRAATWETSGALATLRSQAASTPFGTVRADVVARARADIAAGRLGSEADIARTIDNFLMEG